MGKQDAGEEIEDNIFPDQEGMEEFKHVIENWSSMVIPEGYVASTKAIKSTGTKRARTGGFQSIFSILLINVFFEKGAL